MGDFLTVHEFAKKLGIKDATVYIAIKEDRIQHTKILGRLGIPKTELRKYKRRDNGIETKILKRR